MHDPQIIRRPSRVLLSLRFQYDNGQKGGWARGKKKHKHDLLPYLQGSFFGDVRAKFIKPFTKTDYLNQKHLHQFVLKFWIN